MITDTSSQGREGADQQEQAIRLHGTFAANLAKRHLAIPRTHAVERRTENEKNQLLGTLRVGGLERDPLKRTKQERARICNLMSVVSGLGSLWKRVGRELELELWTQP